MKQLELFPMGRMYHRLSNGRFASRNDADSDRLRIENKRLKFEVEKYKRMYLAMVKENIRLKGGRE